MSFHVWIDQDLCTGDGICTEICPPLFAMHNDGLAYVKEADWKDLYVGSDDGTPAYAMSDGLATVTDELAEAAIEAAEECPGECIFLED